jgi:hypothetical protein
MKKESVRNFNLIDMAVLVVVAALSVAFVRTGEIGELLSNLSRAIDRSDFRRLHDDASTIDFLLSPVLSYWTLGILVLRIRRPRPPLKRLWRQPGFVASCAAGTAILIRLLESLIWRRHDIIRIFLETDRLARLMLSPSGDSPHVGPAVAAAWAILALSGRWRPEASWIDRCGRLIGVLWVLLALIFPIFAWFR